MPPPPPRKRQLPPPLGLPQITASRGSPKRQQLLEKRGTFQVGWRARTGGGVTRAAPQNTSFTGQPPLGGPSSHTTAPPLPPPPPPNLQVPYLEDPNQGVYLFESAAIVDYLYKTYAKPQAAAAASTSA